MSKKGWRRHVHVHPYVHVDVRHERAKRVRRELTQQHHIQEGHGYSCLLPALVLNHFDIQSRRGYACRVSSFVWKFSPHWPSELCVEVASCQHHLRPSQEKKRQRGASSTCEQQFAVRSWADLPWHCLSQNFKCNSVLNSREDVKRSNTWKQRKHEHVPPGTFGRIV